eukprot:CAMPEP_0114577602 /NCGR_PEP_ID=MMETSP0125-20121206/2248_1 /TAXON_ID=485358 ORGANISM="Aristerostoma sp., Strain ATCC 50986" /NCGR_SAMPLE_ID=MMETSP0125 /ASSEMBLY_ACC=CAM_ASM_000245 /LENGTH=140 /DNA_ID=CAMNT_0001767049 /DNA_START=371 /DNA_END=793 /DNA_ORIENTATION=+
MKIVNPVPGILFSFRKESFEDLWHLFKHQVTVGWMSWGEYISHEIEGLYLGWMNTSQMAGYTTARTVFALPYPVPIAIGNATLSFSGNSMGERNVKSAKKFIKAGIAFTVFCVLMIEIFFWIFEDPIIDYKQMLNQPKRL